MAERKQIQAGQGANSAASELSQLIAVIGLAVPALGIVVVDPLMGLVDTACIGRTSTEQLTALAPNSAVFNMMFQVTPLKLPYWSIPVLTAPPRSCSGPCQSHMTAASHTSPSLHTNT